MAYRIHCDVCDAVVDNTGVVISLTLGENKVCRKGEDEISLNVIVCRKCVPAGLRDFVLTLGAHGVMQEAGHRRQLNKILGKEI